MRSGVPSEHVDSARDTTSVSRTVSVGGGEPGEAVVPVPDPGRGPSHTSPRVSKREVRSFHSDDGGGPSRITTRTTSREVLCPTPAVPEEGTHPADKAHKTIVRSTSASASPGMVQVVREPHVGVGHRPLTRLTGSQTFCLRTGCLGCSVLLSGMTGVNTKP